MRRQLDTLSSKVKLRRRFARARLEPLFFVCRCSIGLLRLFCPKISTLVGRERLELVIDEHGRRNASWIEERDSNSEGGLIKRKLEEAQRCRTRLEGLRFLPKQTSRSPKPSFGHPSKTTNFGDLLKAYRSRAGYSQGYLAERARIGAETIGALERGVRRAPYPVTLELLIRALDLSESDRLVIEAAAAGARSSLVDRKREKPGRTLNLPYQLTPLVGREAELSRVSTLLAKNRLVTVTGPSGVGKTRVILEVAARHARSRTDEVCFVDLSVLDANASVTDKILSALSATSTSNDPIQELGVALKARNVLLLFDGCEPIISEFAPIALRLLGICPQLRVLVASSERIGVAGETLFRLPALSFPDHIPASVDEARNYPALALFFERSGCETSTDMSFENLQKIVEICRRLDGIPRAIELAATRLTSLGLQNLYLRLDERYVLAGGGRDLPVRKQMPQEAISFSYHGLTAAEKTLFRRLSVFAASHTLEDAEAVCADESFAKARVTVVLDLLVHKSLVLVAHSGDETRYRVFDLMRSYGLEQLADTGELDEVSKRYARRFNTTADEG